MIHHKKALHQVAKQSIPRRLKRTRVILAGCGQVGMSICATTQNMHCIAAHRGPDAQASKTTTPTQNSNLHGALSNQSAKTQNLRMLGARSIYIDLQNPKQLARLMSISNRVIWLAPPNIGSSMNLSQKYQSENTIKKAILFMAKRYRFYGQNKKPHLVYVSTTGVYGNTDGSWVNEHSPVNPESERAKRRVEAERQVQKGILFQIRTVIIRAPGIYSHTRLPKERLLKQLPALNPDEDSWSNHIHEHDLARLCIWMQFKIGQLNKQVSKTHALVNACDTKPLRMGDYFDLVADHLKLPHPPRMTFQSIEKTISPMMLSFMRESRKVKSLALAKFKFKLKYPSVQFTLSSDSNSGHMEIE